MDKQGKLPSWQQQQAYVAGAARQIEYRKQQQKLRLMASAGQKPSEVSADSLINNILGKKETFQPLQSISSTSNSTIHMASEISPHWLSPSSPLHPALYREVWSLVRVPQQGVVDTTKISPLLLTSGLSTNMLGYIWGLANCKIPGQLIENELYIILALVGLAQNGITFNSINVLNMIPQPPLPKLLLPNKQLAESQNKIINSTQIDYLSNTHSLSTSQINAHSSANLSSPSEVNSTVDPLLDEFTEFQSASPSQSEMNESVLVSKDPPKETSEKFPSVMILGGRSIGSRLANHSLGAPKLKTKQHRPTGSPLLQKSSEELSEYQPDNLFPKCNIKPEQKTYLLKESAIRTTYVEKKKSKDDVPIPQPLMSVEEDKYSALRVLSMTEQTTSVEDSSADDFGDFLSADISSTQDEYSFENIAKRDSTPITPGNLNPPSIEKTNQNPIDFDVEEWCDFTSGEVSSTKDNPQPIAKEIKCANSEPFELLVLESSPRKIVPSRSEQFTKHKPQLIPSDSKIQQPAFFEIEQQIFPDENNEFGDFVGPNEDILDKELFGDFQSTQKEDTQSVSSLELPPLALSRHGSVPSLELKVDQWESQSQTNDQQLVDWIKCLQTCLQHFQFCISTFEGITNDQVFQEIVSTMEGKSYIKNILEIFRVYVRIKKSFNQSSCESKQLENLISTIDSHFNNFKSLYLKAGLPDEELEFTESKANVSNGSSCGICLLDTSGDVEMSVENKNKPYHVSCANFWANCITINLPTPA